MNVALVLSGQPREYQKDMWDYLIKELNADVFIHTWHGIDRESRVINVSQILEDFKPKELSVSHQYKFKDVIPSDSYLKTPSYHVPNLSYSMSNAIANMIQYSSIFNKKYDVVIRSRFDLKLHNVESTVNAVKTFDVDNFLYIAANHWDHPTHVFFDDNIMFGNFDRMSLFSNYYHSVIEDIWQTKQISQGEEHMYLLCKKLNFLNLIKKVSELNFTHRGCAPGPNFILNQNE